MKRIINKKMYNTETSNFVGMVREMHNCSIINLYLFKKSNGEYFLKVNGYPRTLYNNTDFMQFENMDDEHYYSEKFNFIGEGIVPLREKDIEHYLNMIG